jgi:CRISPR-associated protein Csb2
LNGAELIHERSGKPLAVLAQIPLSDRQLYDYYLSPGKVWTTVTPVVLPGHDDPHKLRQRLKRRVTAGQANEEDQKRLRKRLQKRVILLLRKAFEQAGWSAEVLAGALLEYRPVGWFAGLELASNYQLPKVHFPRYHVRVRFLHEIRGPLVLGAGRYRGFGLFAHSS